MSDSLAPTDPPADPSASAHGPNAGKMPLFPPVPAVPASYVGRADTIGEALERLERDGVVGITGSLGVGKSALAAAVATRRNQPIVWVTLSEGGEATVDELLWQLAQPFEASEPELLATLAQMRQAGYAPVNRLQHILAAYARQTASVLICIDQVEQALGSTLRSLLVGMCEYVALSADTRIELIIVGRALPIKLQSYTLPPLRGLNAAEIEAWASALGLMLSPHEIEQIVAQTGGLPIALQALRIAIHEAGPELPVEQIMAVRELRQVVVGVLGTLPIEVQRTVGDLAAHPERYANLSLETLPLIEVLDQQHLIAITSEAVLLHPFLQSYYQQLLG